MILPEDIDLSDPDLRETLAEASYYRERADEAAIDRERTDDDGRVYMCLAWNDLSDFSQRPYRTAVHTVCEALLAVSAA